MTVRKPPKFAAGELNVYRSPREVSDVTRALRRTGRRVMLVPTMGALHDGHLTLVRTAKRVPGSVVVVPIFVNPLQFGANEDLDKYPKTLDDDLVKLRAEGVEIAFTPTAAQMHNSCCRSTCGFCHERNAKATRERANSGQRCGRPPVACPLTLTLSRKRERANGRQRCGRPSRMPPCACAPRACPLAHVPSRMPPLACPLTLSISLSLSLPVPPVPSPACGRGLG